MRDARKVTAFVRAGGLLTATLLFLIALLSNGSWQGLCGVGLAIVGAVMLVDVFARPAPSRAGAYIRAAALAVATLFFFLAAVVSASSSLDMFAVGFAALAISLVVEHSADLDVVVAALRAARRPAVAQAAPLVPATSPPAPPPPPAPATPPPPAPPPAVDACPACGRAFQPGEKFCAACGAAHP